MIVRSLDRVSIFFVFSLTDDSPDKPPEWNSEQKLKCSITIPRFWRGNK